MELHRRKIWEKYIYLMFLNLTRIIRNEEKSISSTLGIPFKQFLIEWQRYYISMGDQVLGDYEFPPETYKVHKKNKKIIELVR